MSYKDESPEVQSVLIEARSVVFDCDNVPDRNLENYFRDVDILLARKVVYERKSSQEPCKCKPDETSGWTTWKLCNGCGKQVENSLEFNTNQVFTSKQIQVLNRAIEKFGFEKQVEMIIEECAELIVALQKLKRDRGEDYLKKLFNVQDEIADVKIMIRQAEILFEDPIINKRVEFKINRLEKRIIEGVS